MTTYDGAPISIFCERPSSPVTCPAMLTAGRAQSRGSHMLFRKKGGMTVAGPGSRRPMRDSISSLALSFFCGALILGFLLLDSRSASALPPPLKKIHPIPAFARKYGMPCSSCHEAWPKLSPFGQAFKDNGYQLGNERDAPIYQHPSYWPVTFRITPQWHRESSNRVVVDGAVPGSTVEAQITTHGFDWSGLDIHTAGTLAKNISFYVLPSADSTGAFHFESVWARLDNLLGSSWLNIKFGKF